MDKYTDAIIIKVFPRGFTNEFGYRAFDSLEEANAAISVINNNPNASARLATHAEKWALGKTGVEELLGRLAYEQQVEAKYKASQAR